MSAALELWYVCDACDLPTEATHDDELLLCRTCAIEAMLSDAADAVNERGERFDVELWALADSCAGLPDAGAL